MFCWFGETSECNSEGRRMETVGKEEREIVGGRWGERKVNPCIAGTGRTSTCAEGIMTSRE